MAVLSAHSVTATSMGCNDVYIIAARGSGQDAKDSNEVNRFFTGVKDRIELSSVRVDEYELGTGWPGYDDADLLYPAVGISDWGNYLVGLGAKTTSGDGFSYGLSVSKGVNELQAFLGMKSIECPDTRFIIGGYSQGAQVVGQALSGVSDKAKNNIVFVALFGDPKLSLPEGKGVLNPPACRGEQFSNWRRDVPDCRTHEGVLGARSLYIPVDLQNKVGLWCNDSDWVCGSSLTPAFTAGHGMYADQNGAIDKAVQEIARQLKKSLPYPKNYYIDDRYLLNSEGEARLNVAYIWATPSSSPEAYSLAQESIMLGAEMIWSQGGRLSVTPTTISSFLHPLAGINGPFGETVGLIASGDRIHTEYRMTYYPFTAVDPSDEVSLVMSAIITMNSLPWQKGAEKAMVFIAESASYDMYGYYYLPSAGKYVPYPDYIVRRALEIDPINTYFVVGSDGGLEEAEYIAKGTGGKVLRYNPDEPETLSEALLNVQQDIIDRPIVIFGNEKYTTPDGEPIVFDVSASYTKSGNIVRYDWDFEGDGEWDQTTTKPHAAHLYPNGFRGLTHVKATDSNSRVGTMTATVESSPQEEVKMTELPIVESIHYEVLGTKNDISTIRLTWEKVDSVPYVLLSVNGVHLGHIPADRTSIDITDIVRSDDVTVDLQVMDENYNIGKRSGVTIPAIPKNTFSVVNSDFVDSYTLVKYTNNSMPIQSADPRGLEAAHDGASNDELIFEAIPTEPIDTRIIGGVIVIIVSLAGLIMYRRTQNM